MLNYEIIHLIVILKKFFFLISYDIKHIKLFKGRQTPIQPGINSNSGMVYVDEVVTF